MNTQSFKLKDFVYYFIIPLLSFLLLKKFLEGTIIQFLVRNLFSYCYPKDSRLDFAVISLVAIALTYLSIKRKKKAVLNYHSVYLFIDYTLIYLLYRCGILENKFELTTFSFSHKFKLLDGMAIISLIGVAFSLIPFQKKEISFDKNLGFIVDEATKIDDENDLLNRSKFIKEITNRIINTDTPNSSFPIGVIAAWGSGKTTFLNTLSSNLKKTNSEIIRIEFNAWKCTNASQIIETFFKQLKSKLGNFSFTFETKIQDYTSNLIKGTKNEGFNSFKNLIESVFPAPSIEKQYEIINNEIKRIAKKIVAL